MKPHIILRCPFIDDRYFDAGCYVTYMKYNELKRAEEQAYSVSAGNESRHILEMKYTWLAFLILSAVALVIVLLLIIFLRNRIRFAVALIKEAGK